MTFTNSSRALGTVYCLCDFSTLLSISSLCVFRCYIFLTVGGMPHSIWTPVSSSLHSLVNLLTVCNGMALRVAWRRLNCVTVYLSQWYWSCVTFYIMNGLLRRNDFPAHKTLLWINEMWSADSPNVYVVDVRTWLMMADPHQVVNTGIWLWISFT